jgi:hypothetical protein
MDWLMTSAARALSAGDPLGALNWVALREDAGALALRGIAMAQLGDLPRAKTLLRRATRAFGAGQDLARARCILAEAEIALVTRELNWPAKAIESARQTLEAHDDRSNAAHARYLHIRHLLLLGRLDEAECQLAEMSPAALPPALRATHELAAAGIAMRRVQSGAAQAALQRAMQAAQQSGIAALQAEVNTARQVLAAPAARLVARGKERPLLLAEVEAVLASGALAVDACRQAVSVDRTTISLATRPVLFTLASALAEAWPADVSREALTARAFRAKHADESQRARLRVEMGRLRSLLRPLAQINATARGFALVPHAATEVVVLAQPVADKHAALLAFLADGEAWSSSALSMALGVSARTVQRALEALAEAGKVQALGQGRAQRWTMPVLPGFATALLLPSPTTDA